MSNEQVFNLTEEINKFDKEIFKAEEKVKEREKLECEIDKLTEDKMDKQKRLGFLRHQLAEGSGLMDKYEKHLREVDKVENELARYRDLCKNIKKDIEKLGLDKKKAEDALRETRLASEVYSIEIQKQMAYTETHYDKIKIRLDDTIKSLEKRTGLDRCLNEDIKISEEGKYRALRNWNNEEGRLIRKKKELKELVDEDRLTLNKEIEDKEKIFKDETLKITEKQEVREVDLQRREKLIIDRKNKLTTVKKQLEDYHGKGLGHIKVENI